MSLEQTLCPELPQCNCETYPKLDQGYEQWLVLGLMGLRDDPVKYDRHTVKQTGFLFVSAFPIEKYILGEVSFDQKKPVYTVFLKRSRIKKKSLPLGWKLQKQEE